MGLKVVKVNKAVFPNPAPLSNTLILLRKHEDCIISEININALKF